jgi:hypothetical protein
MAEILPAAHRGPWHCQSVPDWLCHGTERRALAAFEGLEAAPYSALRAAQAPVAFPSKAARSRHRTSHSGSQVDRPKMFPAVVARDAVLWLESSNCSNVPPATIQALVQQHASGRLERPRTVGEWNTSHGTAGALAQTTALTQAHGSWRNIRRSARLGCSEGDQAARSITVVPRDQTTPSTRSWVPRATDWSPRLTCSSETSTSPRTWPSGRSRKPGGACPPPAS